MEKKYNKNVVTIVVCLCLSIVCLIIQYFFKGGV